MDSDSLTNFNIFSISIQLLILLIVIFQLIKTHCGDCRGMIMTKTKTADGQLVTRQAKLSMHEKPHESYIELDPLQNSEDPSNVL